MGTLKDLRKAEGLSVKQAAARAGIDRGIISDLEAWGEGKRNRPRRRLGRYAEALAGAYRVSVQQVLAAAGQPMQLPLPLGLERVAPTVEEWLSERAKEPVELPAEIAGLVPFVFAGGYMLLSPEQAAEVVATT